MRILWIVSLFAALDTWISLALLWSLSLYVSAEYVRSAAQTLSLLVAIAGTISTLCLLVLLALIPPFQQQHPKDLPLINNTNACLIMASSLFAMFLCIIYSSVNGV